RQRPRETESESLMCKKGKLSKPQRLTAGLFQLHAATLSGVVRDGLSCFLFSYPHILTHTHTNTHTHTHTHTHGAGKREDWLDKISFTTPHTHTHTHTHTNKQK